MSPHEFWNGNAHVFYVYGSSNLGSLSFANSDGYGVVR